MQFLSSLLLVLKYLPTVLQLVEKLEKYAKEGIIQFEVHRDNQKIDLIFKERGNEKDRAKSLNDVFRS